MLALFSGDDTCVHHCVEDKEEDGVDSCVECWANVAEENTKGKNKKKKKKGKGVKCAVSFGFLTIPLVRYIYIYI